MVLDQSLGCSAPPPIPIVKCPWPTACRTRTLSFVYRRNCIIPQSHPARTFSASIGPDDQRVTDIADIWGCGEGPKRAFVLRPSRARHDRGGAFSERFAQVPPTLAVTAASPRVQRRYQRLPIPSPPRVHVTLNRGEPRFHRIEGLINRDEPRSLERSLDTLLRLHRPRWDPGQSPRRSR